MDTAWSGPTPHHLASCSSTWGVLEPEVFPQLSVPATLLALPVAVYEMILAVWLIVKGFNSSAIASESVKTETNELLAAA